MYYKAPDNTIHHLDEDSFAYLLPAGSIPITDEEAEQLRKPNIEQAKAQMWQKIKTERDFRTDQGGYQVNGKWFHSDQKSRSQQLGLVLMGAKIPLNLQWKTMDGSFVTMTATLAQQIFAAAAAIDQAAFANAEAHKIAMEASKNPLQYDYSSGWPAIYGK